MKGAVAEFLVGYDRTGLLFLSPAGGMMVALNILDLLALHGFKPDLRRVKFVRHQDKRYNVHELLRRGWLEAYQSIQSAPVFNEVDYVVSFIGVGGTRARLVGVYRVIESCTSAEALAKIPPDCPYAEWQDGSCCYELQRETGFDDLVHRVVVEWGKAALAWHQWATDKEVVELLPKGQLLRPFQDYLEFTLSYLELRYLSDHAEANKEWRARLSAVAGVYLILATNTGKQYVGSASGAEGIWGRWVQYARNGHGENVLLKSLVSKDPSYPAAFEYSLLQILPITTARSEVLKWERLYKQKLGSQATGLNAN